MKNIANKNNHILLSTQEINKPSTKLVPWRSVP